MGFVRNVVTVALIAGAFYYGYKLHEKKILEMPYRVETQHSVPYLVKNETNERHMITEDFQLGTIEYRLRGLMREGKNKLEDALEELIENYN
jgi:hypothetical protein